MADLPKSPLEAREEGRHHLPIPYVLDLLIKDLQANDDYYLRWSEGTNDIGEKQISLKWKIGPSPEELERLRKLEEERLERLRREEEERLRLLREAEERERERLRLLEEERRRKEEEERRRREEEERLRLLREEEERRRREEEERLRLLREEEERKRREAEERRRLEEEERLRLLREEEERRRREEEERLRRLWEEEERKRKLREPVYQLLAQLDRCNDCVHNGFCDYDDHKRIYREAIAIECSLELDVLLPCECYVCKENSSHNGCIFREVLRLVCIDYKMFDKRNFCFCSECIPYRYRNVCLREELRQFREACQEMEGDDGRLYSKHVDFDTYVEYKRSKQKRRQTESERERKKSHEEEILPGAIEQLRLAQDDFDDLEGTPLDQLMSALSN